MRRSTWLWPILLLVAALAPVAAQEYSFAVPTMELHVNVEPDASVSLYYRIVFQCSPGAKAIDVVDVGLPHANYDKTNMKASLDGKPQTDIRDSEVVHPGVEVHLTSPIAAGKGGVFEFSCRMPDMVYQDTTRQDYASLRITPTWFDSDLLQGETELLTVVYLPQDLSLDEVLYQKVPFTNKAQLKSKIAVFWSDAATRADQAHLVGVSFPQRIMQRVVRVTIWGLTWKWWTESSGARFGVGVLFFVLFTVFFFVTTRGTGCVVYGILAIMLVILWSASPTLEALFPVFLLPLWIFIGRSLKRRRGHYLPAITSTPGGGIKRGLNVPEAAVLLEMPLGRVLALTLFGMLKKGLLTQQQADPLTVAVAAGYEGTAEARKAAAQQRGVVIRAYENDFLDAVVPAPGKPAAETDFKAAVKALIEGAVKRMAGFNVDETKAYYQSIIAKAWQDAKALGDLQARTGFVDDNLEWMMLSPTWGDDFNTWHRGGYYYSSPWTRTGPVLAAGGVPAPTPGGTTSFGDVASSFAGWAENTTGHLAHGLDAVSLGTAPGGGLNLSGVDHVTGDVLKSMASSSGGGGGGGGGCACAGCACACACAGGGR